MTKFALLIGINYTGTSSELRGCINDTKNVYQILTTQYGYDPVNITMLNDSDLNNYAQMPTRTNILNQLKRVVSLIQPSDTLFIGYSGHGSRSKDLNGDESSGYDSCLIPVDYYSSGEIIDDTIRSILGNLPADSSCFVISDCCHSGTICDLKYTLDITKKLRTGRNVYQEKLIIDDKHTETNSNIFVLSGCMDSQTSADAFINNKSQGALTWAFSTVLAACDYKPTAGQLLCECRRLLASGGYEQYPQLSGGKRLDSNTPIII